MANRPDEPLETEISHEASRRPIPQFERTSSPIATVPQQPDQPLVHVAIHLLNQDATSVDYNHPQREAQPTLEVPLDYWDWLGTPRAAPSDGGRRTGVWTEPTSCWSPRPSREAGPSRSKTSTTPTIRSWISACAGTRASPGPRPDHGPPAACMSSSAPSALQAEELAASTPAIAERILGRRTSRPSSAGRIHAALPRREHRSGPA
jgi:hypothetical protein